MGDVLLKVDNLKTTFKTSVGDVRAVRGISFEVYEGEALGIVGESGCGKSVSMLSIMKLLDENAKIEADSIEFRGENLLTKSSSEMSVIQGNDIGMIFQDPMTSLNPLFTIGYQITEPLKIHKKMKKKEAEETAIKMLELVGIPSPKSRLKQYPHEFSGGMRQRVMIAIAMCCNPKLLIADEPTTALDVTIQAQILELMGNLQNQFSSSTILITHDLGVIARVCKRVLVMYGGIIVEEAKADDLFYNTLHPYTMGLLNSVPKEGKDKGKLVPIFGSPPDLLNPPKGCPFAARCKYAMKICRDYIPELVTKEDGHKCACWLMHPKAPKIKKEESYV